MLAIANANGADASWPVPRSCTLCTLPAGHGRQASNATNGLIDELLASNATDGLVDELLASNGCPTYGPVNEMPASNGCSTYGPANELLTNGCIADGVAVNELLANESEYGWATRTDDVHFGLLWKRH